jgi:hypothetical protein
VAQAVVGEKSRTAPKPANRWFVLQVNRWLTSYASANIRKQCKEQMKFGRGSAQGKILNAAGEIVDYPS